MYEAGGYGGIWFAYKKEVDKRSGASGCVRLGILPFPPTTLRAPTAPRTPLI